MSTDSKDLLNWYQFGQALTKLNKSERDSDLREAIQSWHRQALFEGEWEERLDMLKKKEVVHWQNVWLAITKI